MVFHRSAAAYSGDWRSFFLFPGIQLWIFTESGIFKGNYGGTVFNNTSFYFYKNLIVIMDARSGWPQYYSNRIFIKCRKIYRNFRTPAGFHFYYGESLGRRRFHGGCQICFQIQRPCTGKTEKAYRICINWYTAEFWTGCLNRNNNKIKRMGRKIKENEQR